MNCSRCGQSLADDEQFCGSCGAPRPRPDARFQQIENQYFILKGQLAAGRMTREQFDAALKNLMVQDAQGRYWMIGPDTGKWYVHDGQAWVEAQLPAAANVAAPPPPSPQQPPPRKSTSVILIAGGIVAVLCMLAAVSLLLLANLGVGKTAQTRLTDTPIPALVPGMPAPTVTSALKAAVGPTRSGGGAGRIAFTSNRDGNVEIYLMNADGSQPINLTNNAALDWWPSWSPDGARIAFQSDRDGRTEIYVMNANGAYPVRLTNHPAGSEKPAWSPDGTRIAFNTKRDGNWEVYVMNADGSDAHNLTNNPAEDSEPDWSPDGTRLAFNSNRDGNPEIYVMNADGSQEIRLTNHVSSDYSPAWSPDGTRIAFWSNRDGNWEIYVMNADGSQPTRLTRTTALDARPRWSTDGSMIVFSSARDGNEQVYTMKPDGAQQLRLSNNDKVDYKPAWQPRDPSAEAIKATPASVMAFATLWLPTATPRPVTWTVTTTSGTKVPVAPAATLAPTVAASTPVPAATTAPPTAAPTSAPPGLYVTAMGMDQAQPAHGQAVNFTVSFLNTGSGNLSVNWKVYIYRADNPAKSNTESALVPATFPPGTSDNQPVPMNFKLGSTGNDCDYFFARVDTLDSNNKPTELTTTDGKVFEKGFSVCK